jgi:hypothetical protein
MPSDPVCAATDCGNRDNTGRCTAAVGMFGECPLACSYGQFATMVERALGDLGEWKLRQYADGPAKATLRGNRGTVEVWGAHHAHEVWFVQRGTKAETLIAKRWALTDGSLRDAVLRGCAMAGIQTRMEV